MDRFNKGRGKVMYKSPIEVIQGEMTMEFENNVMKAVQNYNINVDKDALISALMYDRQQYEKGYQDAKAEYKDSLSFKELQDIILSIECKEAETYFVKGEILGLCAKRISERNQ